MNQAITFLYIADLANVAAAISVLSVILGGILLGVLLLLRIDPHCDVDDDVLRKLKHWGIIVLTAGIVFGLAPSRLTCLSIAGIKAVEELTETENGKQLSDDAIGIVHNIKLMLDKELVGR